MVSFFWIFKYLFIFEREKERESTSREEQREMETESEAGSRLWAVSTEPDAGLELTDHEIITWAEVGRPTDWATLVPQGNCFLGLKIFLSTEIPTSHSVFCFVWSLLPSFFDSDYLTALGGVENLVLVEWCSCLGTGNCLDIRSHYVSWLISCRLL